MQTSLLGNRIVTLAVALMALILGATGAHAAPLMLDVRPENRRVLVPGPGDGTIQIQVIAPDDPAIRTGRPRLNLALVIDRSGSMAEARKLDFVKTAAHHLVDRMGPDDLLSIVTYSQQVQVPWPSRPVGRNREEIHRILSGLYPGGSTFLSGGLEEGFRQAKGGKRAGTLNRVLLLSDGLANVGVTHRGALRERAGDMAEKGISVSTFGVGNDFDEELMTMIAGGGGGNYRYLGDPERIVAALESEFVAASRTAASEVEIILRLKRECRFGSVLGRDWRREGDAYVVRLGDLSAGERRTVFARLNVAGRRDRAAGSRGGGAPVSRSGDVEGGSPPRRRGFPSSSSGTSGPTARGSTGRCRRRGPLPRRTCWCRKRHGWPTRGRRRRRRGCSARRRRAWPPPRRRPRSARRWITRTGTGTASTRWAT